MSFQNCQLSTKEGEVVQLVENVQRNNKLPTKLQQKCTKLERELAVVSAQVEATKAGTK